MPRKASPGTDDAAWARAFRDVLAAGRAPTGDGWILADELRRRMKVSASKFYRCIKLMRDDGTVEMFDGHQHSEGKWRRAVWYRLIQNRPAIKGEPWIARRSTR
jgi:hypothetical protein